ncbi:MAG: SanA/YdcF family protein [Clostridium sp.]
MEGIIIKKNKKIIIKKIFIIILLSGIVCTSIFIGILNRVRSFGEDNIINNIEEIPSDFKNIIVLGAGIKDDGTVSDILKDRLETTINIMGNSGCENILVSGDHGKEGYNEVKAMKKELLKEGIKEEDIFMDHAGFSTYETMYRAKEVFKVDKAIIVTNKYHLPRALYIANSLGIEVYGIPSDLREYYNINSYQKREALAQFKDFIYVNILKPEPTYLGDEIPISTSDGRVTDDEI